MDASEKSSHSSGLGRALSHSALGAVAMTGVVLRGVRDSGAFYCCHSQHASISKMTTYRGLVRQEMGCFSEPSQATSSYIYLIG